MRRLASVLLTISSLVAFAADASAADLRPRIVTKAPAVAPVAYNWTGWYAGGNIGYSWGRAESNFALPESDIFTGPVSGTLILPGFAFSDAAKLKGVIGGGQFGYNWQTAPNWVFGFETDFQGSGEKGSLTRSDPFALPPVACIANVTCTVTGASTADYTAKIKWFGTVRGRVGYAWDRLLVYGTGGLAYGRVSVSGSNATDVTVTATPPGACPLVGVCFADTLVTPFDISKVKTGWTLGGGIEGAAWDPRWTWKVEYLYMDLGKVQVSAPVPAPVLPGPSVTVDARFTDHIVRFGLNYRFGDVGKGPMVARY